MEENGRPVSFKTPYFTVRFDANAEITSLVDIREDRELIQKGRMGNRLTVYEDRPAEFDAWNIDEDIWRNPGMSLMWKNSKYWRTDRRRRHYMCADGSRTP